MPYGLLFFLWEAKIIIIIIIKQLRFCIIIIFNLIDSKSNSHKQEWKRKRYS